MKSHIAPDVPYALYIWPYITGIKSTGGAFDPPTQQTINCVIHHRHHIPLAGDYWESLVSEQRKWGHWYWNLSWPVCKLPRYPSLGVPPSPTQWNTRGTYTYIVRYESTLLTFRSQNLSILRLVGNRTAVWIRMQAPMHHVFIQE